MTDKPEWPSQVFARRVRQVRESRGWSQAELGRRLGEVGHPLKQARIAAIEAIGTGRSANASVTIDQAVAFARTLTVPVETLLFEHLPPDTSAQTQRLVAIMHAADALREDLDWLTSQIMADPVWPKSKS